MSMATGVKKQGQILHLSRQQISCEGRPNIGVMVSSLAEDPNSDTLFYVGPLCMPKT